MKTSPGRGWPVLAALLAAGLATACSSPTSTAPLRSSVPTTSKIATSSPPVSSSSGSMVIVAESPHPAVSKAANTTGQLADGAYLGYLHAMYISSMTVSFNVARWWSGPEGVKAAVERGYIQPGQSLPNDYYIQNDNPVLRAARMAPNVIVTVARCTDSCHTFGGSAAGLADALAHPNPRANYGDAYRTYEPYWLDITNGAITRIDEQYLP